MLSKQRGSVTVFLCIILAVLIPLSCVLIDVYRYSLAVSQAKTALKICSESILAAYDRRLKEQYGLFAMYPRDVEVMEKEIFELLSQNLNCGASADGVTDLYGFSVRNVDVIPFYNLSEPYVLEQQAVEFMKYRAPVQVVQEFFEKLKVMAGLMKEGDMIERKMSLDKLMNSIREGLVNVSCMLRHKLTLFNRSDDGSDKDMKKSIIADIKTRMTRAEDCIDSANSLVRPIQEIHNGYKPLYDSYIKAKNDYDYLQKQLKDISGQIARKEAELTKVKKKLDKASGEEAQSIELDKLTLEAEISDLKETYAYTGNACNNAYQEYISLEEEISSHRTKLTEYLSEAVYEMSHAEDFCETSKNEALRLLDHITRHITYHSDVIKLIDELTPKLSELEKESQSLLNDTENHDSAVSDQITGSLSIQLKSMQVSSLTDIRGKLSANLSRLEAWKNAAQNYVSVMDKVIKELDGSIREASAAMGKPFEKTWQGYYGYHNAKTGLQNLETGLADLKSLDEMKGYFDIPEYILDPEVNGEESIAFEKWFNKRYYGIEPSKEDNDKGKELEEVRGGVEDFADDVGRLGKDSMFPGDDNSNSLVFLLERYDQLPSCRGETSSDDALTAIGRAIQESMESQVVRLSPFEKSVKGLDTVNESEKGFFDYELERIRELLKIIGDAMSRGLESIIESLYVNEYILSAFKCATTTDRPEHDIGWGRPLDKTFFKQAEVEYILFGKEAEKQNIGCAKRSIFAIRLVFNLLHVYTDPEKVAAALSLATAIAGWTIFGVPIVHNFILIAWAGMESYVDTEFLIQGKSVPLIKTSASWFLGANNLKNYLLKGVKDFVKDKLESAVVQASEAVQETVTGFINGRINELFVPIEKGMTEILGNPSQEEQAGIDNLLKSIGTTFLDNISFNDLDSFKASFETAMAKCIDSIKSTIATWGSAQLSKLKSQLKEYIRKKIFESEGYRKLEENIKKLSIDLVDKGFSAVEGKLDNVLGKEGNSGRNNIAGRLIMMDYTDYLRLMLLALPARTKALRTADLMQINMQEITGEYRFTIDQYNTFVFIKAEVDFNTWFLPESLFRKGDSGMITVEWSQGY